MHARKFGNARRLTIDLLATGYAYTYTFIKSRPQHDEQFNVRTWTDEIKVHISQAGRPGRQKDFPFAAFPFCTDRSSPLHYGLRITETELNGFDTFIITCTIYVHL